MTRSPNGAGPPDSLTAPQDAKSNPSNGLVERVARIIDPSVFAHGISGVRSLDDRQALVQRRNFALSKAREIHALYQQEGVLSSQRGENRSGELLEALQGLIDAASYSPSGSNEAPKMEVGLAYQFTISGASALQTALHRARAVVAKALSPSPATPIGGLSLGVEGDQGASVANSGGTAQAPKSDSEEGH